MLNGELKKYPEHFPDLSVPLDKDNLLLFYKYLYERQMVYVNRFEKKLPPPWTKDEFLKNRKFTNVYRELDWTSVWMIENILEKTKDRRDLFFQTVVFRIFNKPETFEKYGFRKRLTVKSFNFKHFQKWLDDCRTNGFNVFTNAYMITPPAKPERERGILTRNDNYAHVIKFFHDNFDDFYSSIKEAESFEECCEIIQQIPYVGNFKAYQIVVDLTYGATPQIKYSEDEWCDFGPGALLGLKLIFPSMKRGDALKKAKFLRDSQEVFFKKLKLNFPFYKGKRLTLMNIENGLCEFSKYWKMKKGIGKTRLHFKPRLIPLQLKTDFNNSKRRKAK